MLFKDDKDLLMLTAPALLRLSLYKLIKVIR
jgi:hypothetical protein